GVLTGTRSKKTQEKNNGNFHSRWFDPPILGNCRNWLLWLWPRKGYRPGPPYQRIVGRQLGAERLWLSADKFTDTPGIVATGRKIAPGGPGFHKGNAGLYL